MLVLSRCDTAKSRENSCVQSPFASSVLNASESPAQTANSNTHRSIHAQRHCRAPLNIKAMPRGRMAASAKLIGGR